MSFETFIGRISLNFLTYFRHTFDIFWHFFRHIYVHILRFLRHKNPIPTYKALVRDLTGI